MFLTDLLFNSPRLCFSEAQKQAMLSWAKDLGAQDVPSLGRLAKWQKFLSAELGNPTSKHESSGKNIYYLNDIGAAIAKVPFDSLHIVMLWLKLMITGCRQSSGTAVSPFLSRGQRKNCVGSMAWLKMALGGAGPFAYSYGKASRHWCTLLRRRSGTLQSNCLVHTMPVD